MPHGSSAARLPEQLPSTRRGTLASGKQKVTVKFYGEIKTEREHAYLLPKGAALGYRTKAPVFHVSAEW